MLEQKSAHNGFELPALSLGTWMLGGTTEPDPSRDLQAEIQSIRQALDKGITCIDTAELYAGGLCETLVGEAIKNYSRKNLQIISKVRQENLSFTGVLQAAENSLERLKTDYLDVYLVHIPNLDIPLRETMRAMKELRQNGKIKNYGMSNASVQTLKEAEQHFGEKPVLNQVHYNLICREPEVSNLLSYCQQQGIILMAWRPIEKGALCSPEESLLRKLSAEYRKTPAQIAINWLISQPMVCTLSTMRNVAHLEENLGALGWQMHSRDIEDLRKNYPNQRAQSDRVPLV
jgi:diketogulonate reductase-like aldo/keto reductase